MSTTRPTHYEVLEVKEDASPVEIRKAFLRLSVKLHPDKNPDPDASQFFTEKLHPAYETLTDLKKKAAYDRELKDDRAQEEAPSKKHKEAFNSSTEFSNPSFSSFQSPQNNEMFRTKSSPPVFDYYDDPTHGKAGYYFVALSDSWALKNLEGKQFKPEKAILDLFVPDISFYLSQFKRSNLGGIFATYKDAKLFISANQTSHYKDHSLIFIVKKRSDYVASDIQWIEQGSQITIANPIFQDRIEITQEEKIQKAKQELFLFQFTSLETLPIDDATKQMLNTANCADLYKAAQSDSKIAAYIANTVDLRLRLMNGLITGELNDFRSVARHELDVLAKLHPIFAKEVLYQTDLLNDTQWMLQYKLGELARAHIETAKMIFLSPGVRSVFLHGYTSVHPKTQCLPYLITTSKEMAYLILKTPEICKAFLYDKYESESALKTLIEKDKDLVMYIFSRPDLISALFVDYGEKHMDSFSRWQVELLTKLMGQYPELTEIVAKSDYLLTVFYRAKAPLDALRNLLGEHYNHRVAISIEEKIKAVKAELAEFKIPSAEVKSADNHSELNKLSMEKLFEEVTMKPGVADRVASDIELRDKFINHYVAMHSPNSFDDWKFKNNQIKIAKTHPSFAQIILLQSDILDAENRSEHLAEIAAANFTTTRMVLSSPKMLALYLLGQEPQDKKIQALTNIASSSPDALKLITETPELYNILLKISPYRLSLITEKSPAQANLILTNDDLSKILLSDQHPDLTLCKLGLNSVDTAKILIATPALLNCLLNHHKDNWAHKDFINLCKQNGIDYPPPQTNQSLMIFSK